MSITKRLLGFFITMVLAASTSHAQTDRIQISRLNFSPQVNSRRILPLSYTGGSLSALQASQSSRGVFSTGTTNYGSYKIDLTWEDLGRTDGSWVVEFGSALAAGLTFFIAPPIYGVYKYRVAANIRVYDVQGKLVKIESESTVFSRAENRRRFTNSVSRVERAYSEAIGGAWKKINRDYINLNNQLRTAANPPPQRLSEDAALQNIFRSLSENLNRSDPIAILQISGPDDLVSQRLLFELNRNFVSSQRHIVLDRHNYDVVLLERIIQSSQTFDHETLAVIGREIGAKLVVYGIWQQNSSDITLRVGIIDTETRQLHAMASASF